MDVPLITFVVICAIASGKGNVVNQSTPSAQYDTIVVGLGASGIAAASTLARAGRKVLGLEAQDRIGGRVWTFPFGDGLVERGAEWIHGERPSRVYDFAIQNNITLKKQNEYMELLSSDGIPQDQEFFNTLMGLAQGFMEESPDVPESLGIHVTRKLMDYLKENNPEVLNDKDFIEEILELVNLMVCSYEGSTDWNDVSTNSMYEELEGYRYWSWHRYGYKTLFDILLNKYQNGPGIPNLDFRLYTEVLSISWPQEADGKVSVQTKNEEIFTADNVIVTVSLGVLKARHKELFTRPLPDEKVKAIERIPMGLLDKIIFSFSKPWWPLDKGYFAFLWKKKDARALAKEDLWTTKISGASCPMGSDNVLTLWMSGDNAKFMESLPDDVVRRKSLEILKKFMGVNVTIPEPTDMIRTIWYTNPYTRGSYSYDDNTVIQFPQTRATLAQPLVDAAGKPRVLFAGEASEEHHFSTVHGATDSGFREALRLLARSGNEQ